MEDHTAGSDLPPAPVKVSTPTSQMVPVTQVAPIVTLPNAGQHQTCIEKTIIKEVVIIPRGMRQIKSLTCKSLAGCPHS